MKNLFCNKNRVRSAVRKCLTFSVGILIILAISACSLGIFSSGYRELTSKQIEKAVSNNEYDSDEQKALIEYALSLVGRVHYFWGGKYNAKGENPRWGEPATVVSTGHSTSGKNLPLGLDCSGYVSWCFTQIAPSVDWMYEHIGEGTWNQWFNTSEIDKAELKLGDLAFSKVYPGSKSNHIGIVVGFLESGDPIIAHCAPGPDNVVVTTCGNEFNYFRRTNAFDGGE